MQRFRSASARGADVDEVLRACLGELGNLPPQASLGFVYVTDAIAPELTRIVERLQITTNVAHWVGAVGTGVCSGDTEYYDEPAISLLLCAFEHSDFHVLRGLVADQQALDTARGWWRGRQGCFALVHADPRALTSDRTLEALAQELDTGFIAGGLSSSHAEDYQVADRAISGEISGVFLDAGVPVYVDHTQGCTPIGPRHRITRSSRNVAITLDDEPALDVLRRDVGEVIARDLRRVGGYVFAALTVPGSDTGDYMVRNLIGIDEREGLIAVAEQLERHNELMFCRRDGNTAREDLDRMTERLKKRVGSQPIKGGVYVSCLARGRHQFGDNSEEVRAIRAALGEFPMAGFFANGEIYNGRLYGYTGVLTLFL